MISPTLCSTPGSGNGVTLGNLFAALTITQMKMRILNLTGLNENTCKVLT